MATREQLNEEQKKILYLEKKLADAQQKEKELFDIIDTLDGHIFRCGKNDKGEFILLFSEGEIAREYGIRTDQVKGKTVRQIIGDEAYRRIEPYYKKAFGGEFAEYREFLLDNRYFSVKLIPSQIRSDGRIVEVVGITQDITEVRTFQAETRKMAEVLDRIIEFNPYSIQILNPRGHHVRANKAFLELFKTEPDKGWSIFDDPQIKQQEFYDMLLRSLKGEVVQIPPIWYNAHLSDPKYPNNPICIGSVLFPVFLSTGELEYIVLMHEDITDRMKAQEALQKSEKRMKHLLSSNPAVIYTSEVEEPWNWTFISENVTNLTGHDPADFLRNDGFWTNHIHPEDREKIKKEIPRVFRSGHHIMEYRFKCKNGKYIWVLDETKIVYTENGEPVELIGYWIDISKRKKADRELVIAKERAEESDRLKSAFLANMSHEIRTPMNGIMGFADLLKDPDLSEDERNEYIGIIRKSGNRLLNIINDLINISKIESGQMSVKYEETNINEQLDFLYRFFEAETRQKNLKLSVVKSLKDSECTIMTDKEKVYAILTNLIKNAIKFTEEGAIQFGYFIRGENVEFFVKDTGIGISKENQHAILERFIQVDSGFSSGYEGAGLGLSISKAYVELLGGKIWVESELGKGSAFYFLLPLKKHF